MESLIIVLIYFGMPVSLILLYYLLISIFNKIENTLYPDKNLYFKDENKFVLVIEYNKLKIAWKLLFPYSLVIPFCIYLIFEYVNSDNSLFNTLQILFFITVIFLCILSLSDVFLTKKIILFDNKLVKIYKFRRKKELFFNEIYFDSFCSLIASFKRFYKKDTFLLFRSTKGISIDDHLLSNKDLIKFNDELSKISGRSLDEIKQMWFSNKFIK